MVDKVLLRLNNTCIFDIRFDISEKKIINRWQCLLWLKFKNGWLTLVVGIQRFFLSYFSNVSQSGDSN